MTAPRVDGERTLGRLAPRARRLDASGTRGARSGFGGHARLSALVLLSAWLLGCSTARGPEAARPRTGAVAPEALVPGPVERRSASEIPSPRSSAASAASQPWQAEHERQLSDAARADAEVVVLGDGLASDWYGSRSFQRQWSERRVVNLALDGDQTQNVLWRIEAGLLDGMSPRLVILLLGRENLDEGVAPGEVAAGVLAVASEVRRRLPASRLLIVGVLPEGERASDPSRASSARTNAALTSFEAPQGVVVVDAGDVLADPDGRLEAEVMRDFRQPTELGFEMLTIAVSLVAQRLTSGW